MKVPLRAVFFCPSLTGLGGMDIGFGQTSENHSNRIMLPSRSKKCYTVRIRRGLSQSIENHGE